MGDGDGLTRGASAPLAIELANYGRWEWTGVQPSDQGLRADNGISMAFFRLAKIQTS
jgi:hypothetical protein